ncbi:hypothetical protein OAS39_09705 [Pirellulales bacterium]|nr:hypothetical protein [Pirellulales bacterium]
MWVTTSLAVGSTGPSFRQYIKRNKVGETGHPTVRDSGNAEFFEIRFLLEPNSLRFTFHWVTPAACLPGARGATRKTSSEPCGRPSLASWKLDYTVLCRRKGNSKLWGVIMYRWTSLLFGVLAYAFGLGALVFFMLFAGGWDVLPWSIDALPATSTGRALSINVALVALFGLQHSVMARPGFKKAWTRIVPEAIERSCYCVATGIVVFLLCIYWQPMAGSVWHVDNPALSIALISLQLLGWATAVVSSFMINHFELFGLQQTYYRFIESAEPRPTFTAKYLYRFVRHPLQMGILIGIWSTPHMSTSHMFLSAAMSVYITIGLYFEERDLAASLGESYDHYRRNVPMIVPNLRGLSPDAEPPQVLGSDSIAT